jgi:hypothetical protein
MKRLLSSKNIDPKIRRRVKKIFDAVDMILRLKKAGRRN